MVSESSTPSTASQLKVLVVDDNDINLKILSRLLSKHFGHIIQTTSTLSSGVSALDTLSKSEFDLIFLDIDMPELSGVETTIEIRRNDEGGQYRILESNRKAPIIAVTTNTMEADRKKYREAGMNECVGKPICIDELKTAIEKAIGVITLKNPDDFSPEMLVPANTS